ncbi:MAG: hypothetical protein O2910_01110 [Proteobacteria bacterium]|nr:hypothetical protein [Pseudomonadota bacterium]
MSSPTGDGSILAPLVDFMEPTGAFGDGQGTIGALIFLIVVIIICAVFGLLIYETVQQGRMDGDGRSAYLKRLEETKEPTVETVADATADTEGPPAGRRYLFRSKRWKKFSTLKTCREHRARPALRRRIGPAAGRAEGHLVGLRGRRRRAL